MPDDEVLKQIFNACVPFERASAEFYTDCHEARGGDALTREFRAKLDRSKHPLHFLLSGHTGCGKSSELAELARKLAEPHPSTSHERYFPIEINATDYLDDYDADTIDLLLAIVTELSHVLRTKLMVEIRDNYFKNLFHSIKEFFLSPVEINTGAIPLLGAKLEVQRLKTDPDARQKVRDALRPKKALMLGAINEVFDEARLAVKTFPVVAGEKPYRDFVLILDRLERLRRIDGHAEGIDSQREFFLERHAQLTGMKAHVIFTVPIALVCSPGGAMLRNRFSGLFVLPTVKVAGRADREPFGLGVGLLKDLLRKRLDGRTLEEVFEPEALDFCLKYCGGDIRYLMTYVQEACAYSETLPIPLSAAQRAIQQAVRSFAVAIPEGHWEKLAELDRSADQLIPNGDPDFSTMLDNLSVLEYVNGCGHDDPFADAEPWYAVHPVVRELRKFKIAASKLAGSPPPGRVSPP